jgi:hypothetical protein
VDRQALSLPVLRFISEAGRKLISGAEKISFISQSVRYSVGSNPRVFHEGSFQRLKGGPQRMWTTKRRGHLGNDRRNLLHLAEGCAETESTYGPKLLPRMREALRSRHYSRRTEQAYCHWVRRFIYFHRMRHPAEMTEAEINAFPSHLAVRNNVSASTQNQALSALLFLYRHVIGREVGDPGGVIRARKPKRIPVVMTRDEVRAVLAATQWRQMAHGFADVRRGIAADGMSAPSGTGC